MNKQKLLTSASPTAIHITSHTGTPAMMASILRSVSRQLLTSLQSRG